MATPGAAGSSARNVTTDGTTEPAGTRVGLAGGWTILVTGTTASVCAVAGSVGLGVPVADASAARVAAMPDAFSESSRVAELPGVAEPLGAVSSAEATGERATELNSTAARTTRRTNARTAPPDDRAA
jgi:hypothetical protein